MIAFLGVISTLALIGAAFTLATSGAIHQIEALLMLILSVISGIGAKLIYLAEGIYSQSQRQRAEVKPLKPRNVA